MQHQQISSCEMQYLYKFHRKEFFVFNFVVDKRNRWMNRFVSNTVPNIHSTFFYQRNVFMYPWLTDFLLRKLSFVIKEFLVTRSKDRVAINLFKLYLQIIWLACRHITTNSYKTEAKSSVKLSVNSVLRKPNAVTGQWPIVRENERYISNSFVEYPSG